MSWFEICSKHTAAKGWVRFEKYSNLSHSLTVEYSRAEEGHCCIFCGIPRVGFTLTVPAFVTVCMVSGLSLNVFGYSRNISGLRQISPLIFGNFRNMKFEVRPSLEIYKNLRKIAGSLRQSSENFRKYSETFE